MKRHKYKGLLAEKDPRPPLEAIFLQPLEKQFEALRAQQEKLFDALFADCGVRRDSEDGWKRVALTLAERHIKAFARRTDAKLGRPAVNAADDDELTLEMCRIIGTGQKIRSAADIVRRRRGKGETVGAIEQRYRRTMADWKKAHDEFERLIRAQQK